MPYVELHCHSAFSFLDGASHPVELAAAAAEQGHEALALTDHDGLYGAVELVQAARPLGIRAIVGAELTLDDGSHLTLLCEDATGYRNLCRLITRAHEGTRVGGARVPAAESGASGRGTVASSRLDGRPRRATREPVPPRVALEQVERHAEGLVCLSGCARRGALPVLMERGERSAAVTLARRLRGAFGPDRFRVELQRPFARHDRRLGRRLSQLAELIGVPCVATGNVHVHARGRAPLQDAFVAIGARTTLDESEAARRGNSSHVLASPAAMAARFRDHPEAVHESGRLADRLRFDLTRDLGYRYPGAEDPTADRRLAELCRHHLGERYEGRASAEEAAARLDAELGVIRGLGLSGFFLLHRDLLELAREVAIEVRGPGSARAVLPPGRGRGSSVSSIVCFLTGLSHVDPVENDLLLGRFLNEEITALPDIDLDFPRDIRDALIPRVHERYGHDRSALVASFATYRARSAVRDLGKALGLPMGDIERVARAADPWSGNDVEREVAACVGTASARSPRWRALVELVAEAAQLPRHLSQHPGGMVISTRPLIDVCPVVPAAMEGRQLVQWDKESCQDAGFLKIDLLGLGMLSCVERCVEEIERARGERIDLSRIPYDDPEVYAEIQAARTTGVFQIESRAQMQMLPRTLPENLDDLTVQVALVRPGPIQGGAVHPYIERRRARRADPGYRVPYEHPSLEPVLRDTLGAIVFQDQVIEVAMAFAGFSAGEAEGLRRAMSRARSEAAMRAYEAKFVAGGMANGASEATARRVYDQIVGFSGFGFPKAHSAAFGLLAYQSTWLRVHRGVEFLCSLMNEQPMGFYPSDALVHEAQRRGVVVLPPCVLRSEAECRVEWLRAGPVGCRPPPLGTRGGVLSPPPARSHARADAEGSDGGITTAVPPEEPEEEGRWVLAVRMGLGYVKGVAVGDVRQLVAERERGGAFSSVTEVAGRCPAARETLERLAWAGACDGLVEGGRREALWQLGVAATGADAPGGTQLALPLEPGPAPELPALTSWERMVADYSSTQVTLHEHPLELLRPRLDGDVLSSAELEHARPGRTVRVAGLVVARQRPATAKGITFMLLEDEHGTINLIVPVPVHDRDRLAVRAEPIVLASGTLERREGTTNVVVDSVERLERPDLPRAEVKHIEPRRVWSTEEREEDLRAVAPRAHSFGRRGA